MAKFKVLETSYINGQIVAPGDIVDYDGVASANLEPIGSPKEVEAAAKAAAKALRDEAKKAGAQVKVEGKAGEDPSWRDLTDADSDEVVAKAIADAKTRLIM